MGSEQSTNSEEPTQNGKIPEKHANGTVNGISVEITSGGLEIDGKSETTICHNGQPHSNNFPTESTDTVVVESECQPISAPAVAEIPDTNILKEEVKKSKGEKSRHPLVKLFKKKAQPKADVKNEEERETQSEDQTDVSVPPPDPQQETASLKQESELITEPESVTPDSRPEEGKVPESDNGNSEPVESQEENTLEENPVMNFFKTLVSPTKTPKKETPAPDATKDQSQKETQPAATTTVAQISEPPAASKGMSIPPPPPPEPPKMEIKGEPTAKPLKPSGKEEPKVAAKEPESSKGKSAKDTLSKFFRHKETPVVVPEPVVEVQIQTKVEPQEAAPEVAEPVVEVQIKEEVPQPVVETEKGDSSKADTLDAAAKPEPPPPVQEEKKMASKAPFLSFFKPKAAEPKKVTPTPPAATEAAPAVKAKEEPKVAVKSSEQAADNKPASVASQAGDDAANVPKKLEKRNSIQLFFKNLTQKRHSTDAGVQTEPLTAAPGAEKAK